VRRAAASRNRRLVLPALLPFIDAQEARSRSTGCAISQLQQSGAVLEQRSRDEEVVELAVADGRGRRPERRQVVRDGGAVTGDEQDGPLLASSLRPAEGRLSNLCAASAACAVELFLVYGSCGPTSLR
jgi:hypothetical protein